MVFIEGKREDIFSLGCIPLPLEMCVVAQHPAFVGQLDVALLMLASLLVAGVALEPI